MYSGSSYHDDYLFIFQNSKRGKIEKSEGCLITGTLILTFENRLGILRKKDVYKRQILGSETFCSDAYAFWEMAKIHPRIIGDFVWAGMDYMGEVGVGAWEYSDYAPDFSHGAGWITAGSGRIDLTGKPLAEAASVSYTHLDVYKRQGKRS